MYVYLDKNALVTYVTTSTLIHFKNLNNFCALWIFVVNFWVFFYSKGPCLTNFIVITGFIIGNGPHSFKLINRFLLLRCVSNHLQI